MLNNSKQTINLLLAHAGFKDNLYKFEVIIAAE